MPTKSRATKSTNLVAASKLRRRNSWLVVIFGLEFIAFLVLSVSKSYPVIVNFLGINSLASQSTGQTILASGTHQLFDISLVWVVALPLLFGAIAHFLMATVWREDYEKGLKNRVNVFRWADYFISGAFILLALGLVLNVRSIAGLVMLFAAGLLIGAFGLITELRQGIDDVLPYIGAVIAVVAVWIVLAIQLVMWHVYGSGASGYTAWLFFTMLGLTILFFVNWRLSNRKIGKWSSYEFSDKSFMILSLVVKSALAWQIYAYILHP